MRTKRTPAKKTTLPEGQLVTELPEGAKVVGKPEEPKAEELTLNDITVFKGMIEIVSARGAFKPEEMALVGNLYTKLTKFLEQANTPND